MGDPERLPESLSYGKRGERDTIFDLELQYKTKIPFSISRYHFRSRASVQAAITAAYMAVGANGVTIREGISYLLAQFTGAICGAFLIKSILPIEALVHPFATLGSLSDKHGEQVFILECRH